MIRHNSDILNIYDNIAILIESFNYLTKQNYTQS